MSDGGEDKPAAPVNPYAERDAQRLVEKLKKIENLMTWWRLGSPGREPKDPKFREMQRECERIILELRERAKPATPKSRPVQRRKRRAKRARAKSRGLVCGSRNENIIRRRTIVAGNRLLQSEGLCHKFDDENIPLPRRMKEAGTWIKAYNSKAYRHAVESLISKDRKIVSS